MTLRDPLTADQTAEVVDRFYRDGYALVPGVLGREECEYLRRRTDEVADDPAAPKRPHGAYSFVLTDPLEHDRAFAELFIREPILSLVRAVLGPECRFCGQNVIRNKPGEAVSFWHVDDCNRLDYPLPDDVPRWDRRVRLPVHWLSVQAPLTDILTPEDGPTEVVPTSHHSGRLPPKDDPVFDGHRAEPVFCRAGDIYLFNHQVWHRGRPNQSGRTRYLMQLQYARGDRLAVRMQGATRTPRLERVLAESDPRVTEVLLGPPKYV